MLCSLVLTAILVPGLGCAACVYMARRHYRFCGDRDTVVAERMVRRLPPHIDSVARSRVHQALIFPGAAVPRGSRVQPESPFVQGPPCPAVITDTAQPQRIGGS